MQVCVHLHEEYSTVLEVINTYSDTVVCSIEYNSEKRKFYLWKIIIYAYTIYKLLI